MNQMGAAVWSAGDVDGNYASDALNAEVTYSNGESNEGRLVGALPSGGNRCLIASGTAHPA